MQLAPQTVPALLSFCLPGLGQLSQLRYLPAAIFFVLFVCTLIDPGLRPIIPVLAVIAGLETFRSLRTGGMSEPGRKAAYGGVGAIGLISWATYFLMALLPLEANQRIDSDVQEIRAVFRRCQAKTRNDDPMTLACTQADSVLSKTDPWGRIYEVSFFNGVFEVRSLGPDRVGHTRDDLVSTLHSNSEEVLP